MAILGLSTSFFREILAFFGASGEEFRTLSAWMIVLLASPQRGCQALGVRKQGPEDEAESKVPHKRPNQSGIIGALDGESSS
jgi:hypothetical protein